MSNLVRCALCEEYAQVFYLTLDNCLWSVCVAHAGVFVNIAIELDPDKYDLESYFEENYEEEEDEDDDFFSGL